MPRHHRDGDDDLLIGPSEAARLLGVSADAVRVWTKAGRLHCLRTAAGHRLYRRGDVEALARDRARGAGKAS